MAKVSIVIPNYNHAKFLKKRIDSILLQEFQDFEIIILDDCSLDESRSIIESYRGHPKILTIQYNTVNTGSPFLQWNKGISLSTGKFIWIAESDDFADAAFLKNTVPILEMNNNIGLVYCQSFKVNALDEVNGDWKAWTDDLNPELFSADFTFNGIEFINQYLLKKNIIPNASAVIFRRKTFEDIKGADFEIKYCADWNLWLKILSKSDIAFICRPLNYFRYHSESLIASVNEPYFKYDITMRKKWRKFIEANKIYSLKNTANSFLANEYLKLGVFCLNNSQKVKGIYYVLLSSISPKFNLVKLIKNFKYLIVRLFYL